MAADRDRDRGRIRRTPRAASAHHRPMAPHRSSPPGRAVGAKGRLELMRTPRLALPGPSRRIHVEPPEPLPAPIPIPERAEPDGPAVPDAEPARTPEPEEIPA